MTALQFQLNQLLGRMWFLPAVFSILAVSTTVIAYFVTPFAPERLPFTMPEDAVRSILEILASSLLTVAVFALSTVVSALSSASSSTTPRALPLITADRGAQSTISIFIGAFLFSIVGIIGLSVGIYSEAGRLVLFSVTLAVVLLVVTALIRWIGLISDIGRVARTIDAVEKATRNAVQRMKDHPLFDCVSMSGNPRGTPLHARSTGYVQHINTERLAALAEEHGLNLYVTSRPGAHVTPVRPLLCIEGQCDEDTGNKIISCFTVGDARAFESDPRFGLVVFGEIGDKALSPGVNDPGTAIDVIDTVTRIFVDWPEETACEKPYRRIHIAPLEPRDLLEDVYRPLARDGAGNIEVVLRLLTSLETLGACQPWLRSATRIFAQDVRARAEKALVAESDRQALDRAMRDFSN
jgi:uncharacterized membrane protein